VGAVRNSKVVAGIVLQAESWWWSFLKMSLTRGGHTLYYHELLLPVSTVQSTVH